MDTLEYRMIREEDHALVIQHLRKSFFIDEPLNNVVKLCPKGEGHEELEKQCAETMRDGYSIMAIKDGIVVGAVLNGKLQPGDTIRALEKVKKMDDSKFKKIFTLLYKVSDDMDLFNMFRVNKILECRIMSVDSSVRGKGIASELMKRTIEVGKDHGYRIIKGDATGVYSQKMCEKFGMETVVQLYYRDYLDPETGLPVFDVPPPHDTLKIMALRIKYT